MKIGIFDPYLDTLGGGEKYILDIAGCLSDNNLISIFWKESSVLKKAEKRFGEDYSRFKIEKNFNKGRGFDLIFFISDGSIPFLFGKKNFLIFQFPTPWIKNNLTNKIKFLKIKNSIVYSNFVKSFIDQEYGINAKVLAPSVNLDFPKDGKKNIILTVGRFTKGMNTKKQEILLDAFKKIFSHNKDWKFILAGGVRAEDLDFVNKLKKTAGQNVEILTNLGFKELRKLYTEAKIYWHAAGFGEDLEKHPEYAEHFGVSTVEAMGAGAVPVVFNGGGQKEIVEDGRNGFLWNTVDELIKYTANLMQDQTLRKKMSKEAKKRAEYFAGDRFCKELYEIIN